VNIVIDLALIGAAVSVGWVAFRVVQQAVGAVLDLQRDMIRMNNNIQKLAIRVNSVERWLEKNGDFIPSSLDTGLPSDL
jgi:hypothetical protein